MNMQHPFERLAPFIQEYVYRHGWTDLRDIQKAAIPAILDTQDHVLIMSGTASGKTEAAMLPALTVLDMAPAQSVGILYIGPLKALINDQFERIQELLHEKPEIPLQGWHGDIAYQQKKRFLRSPRGVLQITPESLEALLMNRPGELVTLFGDVRFVIIDEIHAFLGTERGQQVLCQLQRLERTLRRPVRRIGLSATIGDTALALQWLKSSAAFPLPSCLVEESTQGRRVELRVNHFVIAPEIREFQATMAPDEIGVRRRKTASAIGIPPDQEGVEGDIEDTGPFDQRWELQQPVSNYYSDLYALLKRYQKTLVFTNRREKVERIAANVRDLLAKEQPGMDWIFVHHGSIATDLREAAEEKMRDPSQRSCTIATSSLELGIDIGHLDLTVQVDAPQTVSSFVQRLGRSGRRGSPSRMCFYTLEYLDKDTQPPSALEQIPWNFLQTIAIIQLYLEERWIEPPDIPIMPLSLLYQQTISILQARTELTPAQLAQAVLTLSPFQAVAQEDYRLFLQHLLALDHLALMEEEGTLIVGLKGARLSSHYHFYSIFASDQECQVFAGTQVVGSIQQLPEVESIIGLAGYAWRVISVDERGRKVHVERAKGTVMPAWMSTGNASFHEHVMLRLRQVLQEDMVYPYLSSLAQQRLSLARELARRAQFLQSCVVPLEQGRFALFPWAGSRIQRTLLHILTSLHWHSKHHLYYIDVVYDGNASTLLTELHNIRFHVAELIEKNVKEMKDVQLWRGKYDYLMPRALLEKSYIHDVFDIPGTMQWLAMCS